MKSFRYNYHMHAAAVLCQAHKTSCAVLRTTIMGKSQRA